LDTLVPELEIDFIVMNNKMGIHQAVHHLVQLEHKRIGYIKSTERISNLEERYESFKIAIKNYNLVENFVEYSLSSNKVGVNRNFQNWLASLKKSNKPSALICENDYLAISVIKSLIDMGINVPEEISVVGFDNIPE